MAEELRQIVRIINVDVSGSKKLFNALRQVVGISYSISNAVCSVMGLDKNIRVGSLSDEEVKKIEHVVRNPDKYGIPKYMMNRRKDYDSGEDKHLITSDLKLFTGFDIKRLKKIKCYKGIRHSLGLPVRGQRTRSHFRHGRTIGVRKKGIQEQKQPKEEKK